LRDLVVGYQVKSANRRESQEDCSIKERQKEKGKRQKERGERKQVICNSGFLLLPFYFLLFTLSRGAAGTLDY
jgi:hypothetical protein